MSNSSGTQRCRSFTPRSRIPNANAQQVKAALKACGILGPVAAPAIVEVAESLPDPS